MSYQTNLKSKVKNCFDYYCLVLSLKDCTHPE